MLLQTVAEETKTDRILRSDAIKKKDNFRIANARSACNKDTTGLVTMNTFSRNVEKIRSIIFYPQVPSELAAVAEGGGTKFKAFCTPFLFFNNNTMNTLTI